MVPIQKIQKSPYHCSVPFLPFSLSPFPSFFSFFSFFSIFLADAAGRELKRVSGWFVLAFSSKQPVQQSVKYRLVTRL